MTKPNSKPTQPIKRPELAANASEIMVTNLPTFAQSQTVAEVKESLFTSQGDFDSLSYLYCHDQAELLVGIVSLRELLSQLGSKPLSDFMTQDLVKVSPRTDPELVARRALTHNLKSLPVVDTDGKLLGAIPSHTLMRIIHFELQTDLLLMSGYLPSLGDEGISSHSSLAVSLKARLPWIVVGLFGGVAMAQVIHFFEILIMQNVVFVTFIPLLVYIAGAISAQTQTLYIREQSHDSDVSSIRFMGRQMVESGIIGLVLWVGMVAISWLMWSDLNVGNVVGIAMAISVVAAAIGSTIIPAALVKLRQDPAIGSGPFATLMTDFISILIYLVVISALV